MLYIWDSMSFSPVWTSNVGEQVHVLYILCRNQGLFTESKDDNTPIFGIRKTAKPAIYES